jgi:hypothetical protein
MEYLEGKTVKDILVGRPVELDLLLDIAIEVADGLNTAHSQRHHPPGHHASQHLHH